jgi:hypothetical protein
MKLLSSIFFISASAFADSTIQWDASPGASGYCLYEVIGSTPTRVAQTSGLEGMVINVMPGTHTYKLSAINSTGEGPMTSAFSVTVTALPNAPAVPLAPKNIKVK